MGYGKVLVDAGRARQGMGYSSMEAGVGNPYGMGYAPSAGMRYSWLMQGIRGLSPADGVGYGGGKYYRDPAIAGIGAAAVKPRAVIWRLANNNLQMDQIAAAMNARIVGPLTGFEDNGNLRIVESLIAGDSSAFAGGKPFAQVMMLTNPNGSPISAAEAMTSVRAVTDNIAVLYKIFADAVWGEAGLAKLTPENRANWYVIQAQTLAMDADLLRDRSIDLIVALTIAEAAPDKSATAPTAAQLQATVKDLHDKLNLVLSTATGWASEATVHAQWVGWWNRWKHAGEAAQDILRRLAGAGEHILGVAEKAGTSLFQVPPAAILFAVGAIVVLGMAKR